LIFRGASARIEDMATTMWLEHARCGWAAFTARHAWARWVEKWGVSVSSLAFGVVTLLVFRRGIEYFPWFVGYLLLLWLAGVVCAEMRQALAARGPRLLWLAMDYTVQSLFHGLLLFLLPIYYASTTLVSRNVGFLLLLVAAALLTAVDPWYRAIVARSRWVEVLLFGFGLFASLNVAFPLVGVRTTWALGLSGIVSLLALTPVFHRGPRTSWWTALVYAGTGAVIVALLLWPVRRWIPPVPLQLTRATFARSVFDFEPWQPVSTISIDDLRGWGEMVAFTAVAAPAGLREPIYHQWRREGKRVEKISLSPVRGGRPGGFRTYSRKTDLGAEVTGTWTVDVLTAHEQLIGRVRLIVTP